MNLTDWRGDPVIPAAWLRGFIALHPQGRDHHPTGGPIIDGTQIGQKQMSRLESALKRRNEDGTVTGLHRFSCRVGAAPCGTDSCWYGNE